MQAMLLKKPGKIEENPLQFTEIPIPEIGPEDILIRVQACGICHTDLHTVEGELPLPRLPIIPGHQVVGIVEKKGNNAQRFKIGDRVGIAWLNSTCGECEFCKSGKENLYEQAKFTGYHSDGGYAQYTAIREDFAYHVTDELSSAETAPLLCAGIIGYRALKLSEIKPKERLGLYGFGASAHIAIQIAIHWNCEVYVFTRSAEHQKLALKLGAAWAGKAEQTPPKKASQLNYLCPCRRNSSLCFKILKQRWNTCLSWNLYDTHSPTGLHRTSILREDFEKRG